MLFTKVQKPETTARIAGLLYLLLIPLGLYGILYVPSILVVDGNIQTTISNINTHIMPFRLSIIVALITQIVNVFLVLYLYKLLKPVNQNLAALMTIFSLLAVPITMLNELNHAALLVLIDLNNQAKISSVQLEFFAEFFLELHQNGIIVAQVFWGLWLLPMGMLIIDSKFIPKALGGLMLIAGMGYLIDVFVWFVYPVFKVEFSAFTFWGEVLLPLWLVIKGVELRDWRRSHFV